MSIQEGLFLSKQELAKYEIIEKYRRGEYLRSEAASKLGCCPRTISRLAKKVREHGITGFAHGNRKRPPSNKVSEEIRRWYLDLYKSKYAAFNFAHALEEIKKREHPCQEVGYTTFVRWLRGEGLGKVKRRRSSKARVARERMANEGLLLQLDGSPHPWNGEDTWCLINAVDDATSKLVGAKFFPSETTWACMDVVRKIIEDHGVPEFILTDQAGWSKRTGKRAHFSQFVRACEELGITIISSSTPETKGRVERSFRTCQDRLTAELSFHGIKTMLDANRYLEQTFKKDWNERFAVEPRQTTTRFRSIPLDADLREVFCLKYQRQVNRDHTVQFGGNRYRLIDPPQRLWKHEVEIRKYEDETIKIFYADEPLATEIVPPMRRYKRVS